VQAANGQSLKAHAHPYFWAPFVLVGDFGRL
jgi:CHAT domain-containing protein